MLRPDENKGGREGREGKTAACTERVRGGKVAKREGRECADVKEKREKDTGERTGSAFA